MKDSVSPGNAYSMRRDTPKSRKLKFGGGGGIRTHEALSSLAVFKTAGFNRSPTPPAQRRHTHSTLHRSAELIHDVWQCLEARQRVLNSISQNLRLVAHKVVSSVSS